MNDNWKNWQGRVVDEKFTLGQYLGGSAHSAVYLTEIGGTQVPKAALKLVAADPAQAERQMQCWQATASLSHPNLQPILGTGRCQLDGQNLHYVVLEYAEEDLSQILPQRSLSPEETRGMLRPVLEALRFLHDKRLVHTRMQPSNIMALGDQIKISSDHICSAGEVALPLQAEGPYRAPEAAAGTAEPSNDIWSLGVTLVETLTQHLPSWRQSPTGASDLAEELPYPFQGIVRHALVRDPSKRWNVMDILSELESSSRRVGKTPAVASVPQAKSSSRAEKERQPVAKNVRETHGLAGIQRRISPLWYVIPALAVGAGFMAWLSLFRAVPHRSNAPAPSSSIGESSPAQVKTTQSAAPKESRNTVVQSAQKASVAARSPQPPPAPQGSSTSELPSGKAAGKSQRGQVLDQVLPDISQKARDSIRGTVRVSVRVQVDPSGSVSQAGLDTPGPSKYFADQALSAAKRWEFISPEVAGRSVPSEWILRFEFKQSGTTAHPKQIAP